ncbi:unnamed protein product [Caenorhabditis auriculariae]|uniref:Uncharacterized protein n=1 Tax=Caenorhabditis auriculariae TaxID=2777116 RepID=A0A8S1H0Q6_9PELO|nr:unnamed protein product [Caenorhabditis auriculariae]
MERCGRQTRQKTDGQHRLRQGVDTGVPSAHPSLFSASASRNTLKSSTDVSEMSGKGRKRSCKSDSDYEEDEALGDCFVAKSIEISTRIRSGCLHCCHCMYMRIARVVFNWRVYLCNLFSLTLR